jgi:hypothetical protein
MQLKEAGAWRKPAFFLRKRNESKLRPFAIIFVAAVEEEKDGGLICAFLKAKPEN